MTSPNPCEDCDRNCDFCATERCECHTEHAWRGSTYVGRRFPLDGPSEGIWEPCWSLRKDAR